MIYPTPEGIYVGSDTKYIGNREYRRERLAFFPLAGGTVPPGYDAPAPPAPRSGDARRPWGSNTFLRSRPS